MLSGHRVVFKKLREKHELKTVTANVPTTYLPTTSVLAPSGRTGLWAHEVCFLGILFKPRSTNGVHVLILANARNVAGGSTNLPLPHLGTELHPLVHSPR